MKRKVIAVRNYIDKHASGTRGTNILSLECGHEIYRKGSIAIPKVVFCKDCADWASGRIASVEWGDTIETWDAEKQMPVFTEKIK